MIPTVLAFVVNDHAPIIRVVHRMIGGILGQGRAS
jgi:hypothetical protein